MRKILIIFMLTMIVLVLYSCKSAPPDQIFSLVRYIESYRLRSQTADFFIEIVLGKKHSDDFCEISFIPKKVDIDIDKIKYIYGTNTSFAHYDSASGRYTATIDYNKVHTAIFYDAGGGREVAELTALTAETPAEELLQKAYEHFSEKISQLSTSNNSAVIEIKILADMSGNAFYYIVFFTDNDIFSLLFDPVSQDIIAEYAH